MNLLRASLICVAFVIPFHIWASGNNYPAGARAGAMGNSSLTFRTVFSSFHNQAGLGYLEEIQFGAAYRNNFLLKQTGLKSAALAIPVSQFGVVGLSVNSFGYSEYGEHKFGLAYAKKFADYLSMGIQINYLQTQFNSNYGSRGVIVAEFGVMGKLTDELTVGAHIYNPTRTYLSEEIKDRVPTIVKAGLGYEFSEKLLTTIEVEKDLDIKKANFKAGLEYRPYEPVALRFGFNSYDVKLSFGLGVYLGNLQLDIASEYHQTLGFVPQASAVYKLAKRKKKDETK
jgi:hypothetical protein